MIIFWVMLISTGIGSVLFSRINCRITQNGRNAQKERNTFAWTRLFVLLTFSVMIFFASMRSTVSDTWAYAYNYEHMPNSLSQVAEYASNQPKDKFFWVSSMIFKCIVSDSYHVWFLAVTLICCILISSTIARYSEKPFLSAFMFILTCNFTWLFNGMRQFLAASIVFYAIRFIEEKNLVKYVLLCAAAALFHLSALICIPVYFIVGGKAGNKKIIFSCFAATVFLFSLSILLPVIQRTLTNTEYSHIISEFETDDGVNIIRTIISIVPAGMFFLLKHFSKKIKKIPPSISIAVNMSILSALVNLIGRFTSGIYVGRLSIYFELSSLYLYPWIFNAFFSKKNKKIVLFLYIFVYFLYFYYQMVITWNGFGYESDVLNIRFR